MQDGRDLGPRDKAIVSRLPSTAKKIVKVYHRLPKSVRKKLKPHEYWCEKCGSLMANCRCRKKL